MTEDEPNEKLYDVIVTTLFIIGIGLNVYLMVDASTDGELTRQVGRVWEQHVREPLRKRQDFLRDRDRVIAHARWFTWQSATTNERTTDDDD